MQSLVQLASQIPIHFVVLCPVFGLELQGSAVHSYDIEEKDSIISLVENQKRFQLEGQQYVAGLSRNNGDCVSEVVSQLNIGCNELTSVTKTKFAAELANCHIQTSGRPSFRSCTTVDAITVADCTAEMDDTTFLVYTEFFTHIDSICHHLQSEQWRSKTELLVTGLVTSASTTLRQLTQSEVRQEKLLSGQHAAASNIEQMIKTQEELRVGGAELMKVQQALGVSLGQAREKMGSLELEMSGAFAAITEHTRHAKAVMEQQQQQIEAGLATVDHIHRSLVAVGESFPWNTLMFFSGALLAGWLATSPARTRGARALVLLVISLNALLERVVTSLYLRWLPFVLAHTPPGAVMDIITSSSSAIGGGEDSSAAAAGAAAGGAGGVDPAFSGVSSGVGGDYLQSPGVSLSYSSPSSSSSTTMLVSHLGWLLGCGRKVTILLCLLLLIRTAVRFSSSAERGDGGSNNDGVVEEEEEQRQQLRSGIMGWCRWGRRSASGIVEGGGGGDAKEEKGGWTTTTTRRSEGAQPHPEKEEGASRLYHLARVAESLPYM